MAVELVVPSVGESITEVMIGEWLVEEGVQVKADQALVEIESDKATVELNAPTAGTVTQMLKKQGDMAEVGEVIGYMEAGEGGATGKPAASEAPAPEPATPEPASPEPAQGTPPAQEASPASGDNGASKPADAPAPATSDDASRVMPAAQRELAQRGIEASAVAGTGPGGRILKEDVVRHAESAGSSHEAPAAEPAPPKKEAGAPAGTPAASEPKAAPAAAPSAPKPAAAPAGMGQPTVETGHPRETRTTPITPMRKRIAERLVYAQQTAAMLTTFNEIDMGGVMALRKEFQDEFVAKHGIKLGFMSFFVKACVDALQAFPQVNAEMQDNQIVYYNYCDIGIAVGGGKGLVVPVIRNAETMSLADLEKAIADFGMRARDNKINLQELQGGTFSITNGGIFGSLMSTPILNPPQSGILGMHKIEQRPMAINGEVVIRPMMYVALTYDHRIVDGREAVSFLVRVKQNIERPERMLLDL